MILVVLANRLVEPDDLRGSCCCNGGDIALYASFKKMRNTAVRQTDRQTCCWVSRSSRNLSALLDPSLGQTDSRERRKNKNALTDVPVEK